MYVINTTQIVYPALSMCEIKEKLWILEIYKATSVKPSLHEFLGNYAPARCLIFKIPISKCFSSINRLCSISYTNLTKNKSSFWTKYEMFVIRKGPPRREAKCIKANEVHYTHIKVIFSPPNRIGPKKREEKKSLLTCHCTSRYIGFSLLNFEVGCKMCR